MTLTQWVWSLKVVIFLLLVWVSGVGPCITSGLRAGALINTVFVCL